jgi:glucose-6-phosphate 1-dehydrogenase
MPATYAIENPRVQELPAHAPKPAGPCAITIFGVTGDLSKRLLFPALYNLAQQKLLSEQFAVVGYAASEIDEQPLRDTIAEDLRRVIGPEADEATIRWVVSRLRYIASDFESDAGLRRLHEVLAEVDRDCGTGGNYLFYMATSPEYFLSLTKRLAVEGLTDDGGGAWRRVIIEKPFGHDLESARALNRELLTVVRDDQIYRIDHYLGKETVQNVMVFRFANGVFEPIWNRRYIDHVQITVAETAGVERRGRYYDRTGALRDMVPNHMVQLLALTAMEPPSSFSATALQNEQVKVLEAVQPIDPVECPTCVVRGQYGRGTVGGLPVPGYREEPYVDPHSLTETFVALKIVVDNWRWAGVPFYMRTGKRLRARKTEIMIQFRNAPLALFRHSGLSLPQPNSLVVGIQPQESISLVFQGKVPGPAIETSTVDMHFDYRRYFGMQNRTGYETLLYDAIIGDSTLFKRADTIEAGWAAIQPILRAWGLGRGGDLHEYQPGSDGPDAASELIRRDGHDWRPLDL